LAKVGGKKIGTVISAVTFLKTSFVNKSHRESSRLNQKNHRDDGGKNRGSNFRL